MNKIYWAWLVRCGAILGVVCGVVFPSDATASVESFYSGKRLTIYIGSNPGGGYDRYGRTVARHITRHIPGQPTPVAKNRPGAGGLILINYLSNKALRDGSVIGIVQNALVLEPLLGNKNALYKATEMTWLGSVNKITNICLSWHTSGVDSIRKLKGTKKLLVGVTTGSSTETVANLLKNLVGSNFQLVRGYPGTTSIMLAMERGEVGGLCGVGWDSIKSTKSDYLKKKKLHIIVQVAPEPHPELKDVPFIYDLVDDPEKKKILDFLMARMLMGRPFVAPPALPADRTAALRKAFWDTMKDPKFLANAKKVRMPVLPISGEQVQRHVAKLYRTSPEIIAKAQDVIKTKGRVFQAKLNWKTVKATKIEKVRRGGRRISFRVGGKLVKVRIGRTRITIDGKKVKRKKLKVGLVCDISYLGDGDAANKLVCKK